MGCSTHTPPPPPGALSHRPHRDGTSIKQAPRLLRSSQRLLCGPQVLKKAMQPHTPRCSSLPGLLTAAQTAAHACCRASAPSLCHPGYSLYPSALAPSSQKDRADHPAARVPTSPATRSSFCFPSLYRKGLPPSPGIRTATWYLLIHGLSPGPEHPLLVCLLPI